MPVADQQLFPIEESQVDALKSWDLKLMATCMTKPT